MLKLFGLSGYSAKQIIALFTISALLLIENIDGHILNIAIPRMAIDLHTDIYTLKLAVTSYLIGLAIFIPISGWLANTYGSKNVLACSITLFILMSLGCGYTCSLWTLIICRFLQGVSGAFMVPVGRLLLLKMFGKSELVKTYTLMSIPVMLGPILAPVLGGYLVSFFSWRYIFWVNIPFGVLTLILTLACVENFFAKEKIFSLMSFLFLGLCLATISFWLNIILLDSVLAWIKYLLFACSLVSCWLYLKCEKLATVPLIRYRLFKLRTFRNCFWATGIIRAALGGRVFILAIYLETAFHLPAFEAGFYFAVMSLGVLLSRTVTRVFIERLGFKSTLTLANAGSFLVFIALAVMLKLTYLTTLAMFLSGLFTTTQFMCFNLLFYDEVEASDYASAVSLTATWHQLGLAFGVVVATGILHLISTIGYVQFAQNEPNALRITFVVLALINLACQFMIQNLNPKDGNSLVQKT